MARAPARDATRGNDERVTLLRRLDHVAVLVRSTDDALAFYESHLGLRVQSSEVIPEPHVRLTLTLPVLTRARAVFVLVAGATKAEALRHVLEGAGDWIKYPAAGIRLAQAPAIWWADREAAALVPDERDSH